MNGEAVFWWTLMFWVMGLGIGINIGYRLGHKAGFRERDSQFLN